MWYVIVFFAVAILAIVVWFVMRSRPKQKGPKRPVPHGVENASRTPHGSPERKERARRRNQSKRDRRKRH